MLWRNARDGLTVSEVISKPANSAVFWAKMNLSLFSVMPWRPHISSHSTVSQNASSMLSPQISVSSMHFV